MTVFNKFGQDKGVCIKYDACDSKIGNTYMYIYMYVCVCASKIVVEVKALRPPHVQKLWLGVDGDHKTVIKLR